MKRKEGCACKTQTQTARSTAPLPQGKCRGHCVPQGGKEKKNNSFNRKCA